MLCICPFSVCKQTNSIASCFTKINSYLDCGYNLIHYYSSFLHTIFCVECHQLNYNQTIYCWNCNISCHYYSTISPSALKFKIVQPWCSDLFDRSNPSVVTAVPATSLPDVTMDRTQFCRIFHWTNTLCGYEWGQMLLFIWNSFI